MTAFMHEHFLGRILMEGGHITQTQLDAALLGQRSSGRRIGEELIAAGHTSSRQVEAGLSLQHKRITCALALAIGLSPLVLMASVAEAAQVRAALQVSVTVIANARMQVAHQESILRLSAADIARGYVEIPNASRFAILTNSRLGYQIELQALGRLFESVQVGGLGQPVQLGAEGGVIVVRGRPTANPAHTLSFRFKLHPDANAGDHPWPVHLSVRALS